MNFSAKFATITIFALTFSASAAERTLTTQERVMANVAYIIGAYAHRPHTRLVSASEMDARLKDGSVANDSWRIVVRKMDNCIFSAIVNDPNGGEFGITADFNRLSDRYIVRYETVSFLGDDVIMPLCSNWPRHEKIATAVFSFMHHSE